MAHDAYTVIYRTRPGGPEQTLRVTNARSEKDARKVALHRGVDSIVSVMKETRRIVKTSDGRWQVQGKHGRSGLSVRNFDTRAEAEAFARK